MKKIFSATALIALLLVSGCQKAESLDISQFKLEGKIAEEGGTECSLIDLKTNEKKGTFTNPGVNYAEGCWLLGSFEEKVFARVSPPALGGVPYQHSFPVYEINTKTGLSNEVCNLNSFIDPDSTHVLYERAFCVEQNSLYIQNFKTNDTDVEFSIPQEFDAFGDFYLNSDGSMLVLSAAKFENNDFYEGTLSTSILIGDLLSGEIKELYSSEDFINILEFQENKIQFKKDGQECSIDLEGENVQCS